MSWGVFASPNLGKVRPLCASSGCLVGSLLCGGCCGGCVVMVLMWYGDSVILFSPHSNTSPTPRPLTHPSPTHPPTHRLPTGCCRRSPSPPWPLGCTRCKSTRCVVTTSAASTTSYIDNKHIEYRQKYKVPRLLYRDDISCVKCTNNINCMSCMRSTPVHLLHLVL